MDKIDTSAPEIKRSFIRRNMWPAAAVIGGSAAVAAEATWVSAFPIGKSGVDAVIDVMMFLMIGMMVPYTTAIVPFLVDAESPMGRVQRGIGY